MCASAYSTLTSFGVLMINWINVACQERVNRCCIREFPSRLRSRTTVVGPVPEVMRATERLAGRDGVVLDTAS